MNPGAFSIADAVSLTLLRGATVIFLDFVCNLYGQTYLQVESLNILLELSLPVCFMCLGLKDARSWVSLGALPFLSGVLPGMFLIHCLEKE
jgi:hypothetical protein